MTHRTRHLPSPAARCSTLWRFLLLIGSIALFSACSAPDSSDAASGVNPVVSDGPAPTAAPESDSTGGRRLDSDELAGLGELGLLPTLLPTFSSGDDCAFDDVLSTCQ